MKHLIFKKNQIKKGRLIRPLFYLRNLRIKKPHQFYNPVSKFATSFIKISAIYKAKNAKLEKGQSSPYSAINDEMVQVKVQQF
jgi:hypothetical protein